MTPGADGGDEGHPCRPSKPLSPAGGDNTCQGVGFSFCPLKGTVTILDFVWKGLQKKKRIPKKKKKVRLFYSQDQLCRVVTPSRDQLLLPPLRESGQNVSGSALDADGVLLRPDLQADQHHPDVELHVDLEQETGRTVSQSTAAEKKLATLACVCLYSHCPPGWPVEPSPLSLQFRFFSWH